MGEGKREGGKERKGWMDGWPNGDMDVCIDGWID